MEERKVKQSLRGKFGELGWALFVYYLILNISVIMFSIADLALFFLLTVPGSQISLDLMLTQLMERILGNGWGYLFACVIGTFLMLMWKKNDPVVLEIWKRGKPMKVKHFIAILCVFTSGQVIVQVLTPVLEWLFQRIGLSVTESLEYATIIPDTLSMFLYACVFAPIFEEIFFRGLVLRSLMPYGKKFSIVASAFLFSIFHGNIIQSSFAFLVGLVLGYTAAEYSIVWSMLLHFINNFVLGDLVTRLSNYFPPFVLELSYAVLIWGCFVVTLILAAVNADRIGDYLRNRKIHPWCLRSFFTSPGILAYSGLMVFNILLTFLLQMI